MGILGGGAVQLMTLLGANPGETYVGLDNVSLNETSKA